MYVFIVVPHTQGAQAWITQFYLQITPYLPLPLSVHQMASPRLRLRTSNCSLILIYLPRKDEKLSWPGWLTYSGRFTHISGLLVERRTAKARRSKTNVLPLSHGTNQKIIRILENMYKDTFSTVRVNGEISDWFDSIVGVLQVVCFLHCFLSFY